MLVCCDEEVNLLVEALQQFSIKQKVLGDLSVTWDPKGAEIALDRALACKDKWLPALESGGLKVKRMQTFIKGINDPDRPAFGRLSYPADADPMNKTPAKNTKMATTSYYRRFIGTYERKRRW